MASLEGEVDSLEGERDALEDLLAVKWGELEGVEERLVVTSRNLARKKGAMTFQRRKEAVEFDRTNKTVWSNTPNHRQQKSRAMMNTDFWFLRKKPVCSTALLPTTGMVGASESRARATRPTL